MRLLFIASQYPPLTGGGASRIYDFARMIASRGHACYVVTYVPFRLFRRARPFELKEGVHVLRLPSLLPRNPVDQIIPVLLLVLGFALIRRPRAVVMSLPAGEPAVGAILGAKVGELKTVFDVRDEWEEAIIRRRRGIKRLQYQFYKHLFTALYKKATLTIGVTPTLVRSLQQRGVARVLMIPNGADTELFKPLERDPTFLNLHPYLQKDDFIAIYAGHVGWYYRIDILLQAVDQLRKAHPARRFKLIVMGEGEKLKDYKLFAEKLGLKGIVVFTGEVSRMEVAAVMNRCDLGVIPYDDDPLWKYAYPTKIFEHCASGLPTVASIVGDSDLEHLIDQYGIGLTVKPLSIDDFAEGIERLTTNAHLRDEMRKKALAVSADRFSRQKTAEELLAVIQDL